MNKKALIQKIKHALESMQNNSLTATVVPVTGVVPYGITEHSTSRYTQQHGKDDNTEQAVFWNLVVWKSGQVMLQKIECKLHSYQTLYHPLKEWHSERPTQITFLYRHWCLQCQDGDITNREIEDLTKKYTSEASV